MSQPPKNAEKAIKFTNCNEIANTSFINTEFENRANCTKRSSCFPILNPVQRQVWINIRSSILSTASFEDLYLNLIRQK